MHTLSVPENLKDIRLIVFDMAGTTVRDLKEVESCFDQAARQTGLQMTAEEITAVQGWSKSFVFSSFWKRQLPLSPEKAAMEAINSYHVFRTILENHYLHTPLVSPTEGCLELLHVLKEKQIMVALTTGFYRKVSDLILGRLGWASDLDAEHRGNASSLITYSVSSDEVEQGRPAPDMIFRAMKELNITQPDQVLNLGDTPSDLESGKRAGALMSIGLANGTHTRQQLEEFPNDGIFDSLSSFQAFLLPALAGR